MHPQSTEIVSGRLTLRVAPELHRRVVVRARQAGKSLNQWIAEALQKAS